MHSDFIVGIDLGSRTIRIVAGRDNPELKGMEVVAAVESESRGVSKGVITNLEEAVSSISEAVEKMEKKLGTRIAKAKIGVAGPHISAMQAKELVVVNHPGGEITNLEIQRARESIEKKSVPPNYEVLHVIPTSFTIDNQVGVKNPIGMIGSRLEMEAYVILGLSNQLKSLETAFSSRCGIEITSMIFTALASAEAVLNKEQKELGVVLVDIGEATTSIIVFEEEDILLVKVLPLGARYVTADIALGLKIPMDLAEKIKVNYGYAYVPDVPKFEEIDLSELDPKVKGNFSKKEIAEIISSRYEEIFSFVDEELQQIDRSAKLPAGVVLVGAGSRIGGLENLAKQVFKLPAGIGIPVNIVSETREERIFDPAFAASVGLLLREEDDFFFGHRSTKNSSYVSKFLKKVRNLFIPD